MTNGITALPGDALLRIRDLVPHIVPVSRATLWNWVATGRFPKPVKVSARVTAWLASEVQAWIRETASKRASS